MNKQVMKRLTFVCLGLFLITAVAPDALAWRGGAAGVRGPMGGGAVCGPTAPPIAEPITAVPMAASVTAAPLSGQVLPRAWLWALARVRPLRRIRIITTLVIRAAV